MKHLVTTIVLFLLLAKAFGLQCPPRSHGENRMVCASNDEVVVTYAYDHRGRMVRKDVLPTSTNSTSSILHSKLDYLWDDWNIIRETLDTPASTLVTHNDWGLDLDGSFQGAGGVGGLLAVAHDAEEFLPTYDANGNISEYVYTNGSIVVHYVYSPFGRQFAVSSDGAASFTHQFSTKPYCSVTSFTEYLYRKYRPNIGCWINRDPDEENGGIGLYNCLQNAIANGYDYLGLLGDERIEGPGTGTITRGTLEHHSYLSFVISCPKCYRADSIRVRGIRQAIACIASNEVQRVYQPSPNPRNRIPAVVPRPNPDPRKRPKPQLTYDERIANFIHYWESHGVSDLKDGNGGDSVESNCDGNPIALRATMRTRFAGIPWGTQKNAECYQKGIAIGYKCVPCGDGQ